MRTSIYAAILVGLLPFAGSAVAADLGPYDEPELTVVPPVPVAVLPPPQVPLVVAAPPCGVYRPCVRRFGYFGPRPYRFYPRPAYAYDRPAYAPIGREGYGYDYDRERYEHVHDHVSHYGYGNDERPRAEPYERRYERRDRAERYRDGQPYADPLGHDRGRGERLGGYDRRYDEHRDERFEREPRGGPGPYDRG